MVDGISGFEVGLDVQPFDAVDVVDVARVVEAVQDVPRDCGEPVDVHVPLAVAVPRAPAFVPVAARLEAARPPGHRGGLRRDRRGSLPGGRSTGCTAAGARLSWSRNVSIGMLPYPCYGSHADPLALTAGSARSYGTHRRVTGPGGFRCLIIHHVLINSYVRVILNVLINFNTHDNLLCTNHYYLYGRKTARRDR